MLLYNINTLQHSEAVFFPSIDFRDASIYCRIDAYSYPSGDTIRLPFVLVRYELKCNLSPVCFAIACYVISPDYENSDYQLLHMESSIVSFVGFQ